VDRRLVTAQARPAATVCLLRDGEGGLEVLMAERAADARFMAGVWVFPGGAVDEEDAAAHSPVATTGNDRAWRAAALRELVEEMGIWVTTTGIETRRVQGDVYAAAAERDLVLDGNALGYFANWITPASLPIRFDTRFYAAAADAEPEVDGEELVTARWIAPQEALARSRDGDSPVAFPTARSLAYLGGFATAQVAADHIAALDRVPPIQPSLRVDGDALGIVLPGEPGFEEAAAAESGLGDRIGGPIRGEPRVNP
jgi:8-oxo-dGTP pyrophosphatase MutT (NUDIX family)